MPRAGIPLASPAPLGELIRTHGGSADPGADAIVVERIAPIELATDGELAPFTSLRHRAAANASRAVLLVDAKLADAVPPGRRWLHEHASWALAGLLATLEPPPPPDRRAEAFVSPEAEVAADARIAPGAVVLSGAVVGPACTIEPNAVVYGRVVLGARVHVGASAVVGRAGFGWAFGPAGGVRRIPQLGGVVVEDDVEIGPLATIDAGTLGPTVIGRGARLDAHVHVGHNVVVGAGSIVAAQSGFAGSVRVGARVLVGGQAGVADHVTIGDGARLAAKAGVIADVPAGEAVAGYPAVSRLRWLRGMARVFKK